MSTVIQVPFSTSSSAIILGVGLIIASIACLYDKPFYYVKMLLWSSGFAALGTGMSGVGAGTGFIGAALVIVSMAFPVAPPILYLTLSTGAVGGILLGRTL